MQYAAMRLVRAVITVFCVVTIAFYLVSAAGPPAAQLLGPNATPADIAALNKSLGYARPLIDQYLSFIGNAVKGSFGQSLQRHEPAMTVVTQRLPATLELAVTSFVVGLLLALILAVVLQLTGSEKLRSGLMWVGSVRQALPEFLFGVLLVLIFAVKLHWFPALGNQSAKSLVLPVATLASLQVALYLRLFDSALGEQMAQDYVRTAFARGRSRTAIVLCEALPNALLPILTVAGLNLGSLLGGTLVIEIVFSWPGLGQALMAAVDARDAPVVQAGLLVIAVIFVGVNFVVDLLYAVLDPRVRLG
jgi:peptide/nickel transport system permease protein